MAANGHIRVLTFKEGVLSRLGHDLQLSLERYEVHLEAGALTATMWPTSLRIDGAMVKGRLDRFALDADDRRKIGRNVDDDVLHTRRHATVELRGQVSSPREGTFTIEGELTLVGHVRPFRATLRLDGDRLRARIDLVPSRWGIKPYRAPLGALKVQDRVIVELDLPTDVDGFDRADPVASTCTWSAP